MLEALPHEILHWAAEFERFCSLPCSGSGSVRERTSRLATRINVFGSTPRRPARHDPARRLVQSARQRESTTIAHAQTRREARVEDPLRPRVMARNCDPIIRTLPMNVMVRKMVATPPSVHQNVR